ncbi:hypothetical protein C1752_06208 [Acaryochloris thomasi RCC1774]|uniref:Uncharacterized protein n=1 Tax=Acaryochloris thomasi RCC1774 TaxID=1764569 RepID=A0A2W1JCQ6_9CYAN|nr:hypothetical protein [Acaryochloris thomasi]PZD71588.1 hypothetical protein C1752_06208 [Acaryochloris thomasi RCC1774]
MCVGCYALSVMTLVSPVNEAPQPANLPALSQPAATPTQIQKELTPAEVRDSLASFLKRLPATPNAQILRTGFGAMQTQLVGVNDMQLVYDIVGQHMTSLTDQVLAAPNSAELLQILQETEEEPSNQQASRTLLNSQSSHHWGWLS